MGVSEINVNKLKQLLFFFDRDFIVYYCIISMDGVPRREVVNFIENNLKFKNGYKYLKKLELRGYISFIDGQLDIIKPKYEEMRGILTNLPLPSFYNTINLEDHVPERDYRNQHFNFTNEVFQLLRLVKSRIKEKEDLELYKYFKIVRRAFRTELVLKNLDLSLNLD